MPKQITIYLSDEQVSIMERCKSKYMTTTVFFEDLLEDKRQIVDGEAIWLPATDSANVEKLAFVCSQNDLSTVDTIWKTIKQEYWLLKDGRNQRSISERIESTVTEIMSILENNFDLADQDDVICNCGHAASAHAKFHGVRHPGHNSNGFCSCVYSVKEVLQAAESKHL